MRFRKVKVYVCYKCIQPTVRVGLKAIRHHLFRVHNISDLPCKFMKVSKIEHKKLGIFKGIREFEINRNRIGNSIGSYVLNNLKELEEVV